MIELSTFYSGGSQHFVLHNETRKRKLFFYTKKITMYKSSLKVEEN